jgi:thiol peroxidase
MKTALKGNIVNLNGDFPAVGSLAPDFNLRKLDLSDATLLDYKGKNLILNIFPSVDTSVCSASVRQFNVLASQLVDTTVLCISNDLPFAQSRFCGAEGIKNVEMLSGFNSDFGVKYGVYIADSPMRGLLARAVIIIDRYGKIKYTQLVSEITIEPDYTAALEALKH